MRVSSYSLPIVQEAFAEVPLDPIAAFTDMHAPAVVRVRIVVS